MKRLRATDRVHENLGIKSGNEAEYIRGEESLFALKPNHLTMVEAAAVPPVCVIDYHVFFNKGLPTIRPRRDVTVFRGTLSSHRNR